MFPLLTLLMAGIFATNPNHWEEQVMFGELGIALVFSYEVFRRVGKLPALVFLYFSTYSVYCCYAHTKFLMPGYDVQTTFNLVTRSSLIFFMFATMPFVFAQKNDMRSWLRAFQIFAVLSSMYMIYNRFFSYTLWDRGHATGFIGMDSIDGSFLALMLPFFVFSKTMCKEDKALGVGLLASAILCSQSSTVFGILCLEAMIFAFQKVKLKFNLKKALATFFGLSVLSYPIGYLYLGNQLFESNGRQFIHKEAFRVFNTVGSYLMGLGTGSFVVLMPLLQGPNHPVFAWMHDEPMNVMFEQGIVGFLLLSILYGYMVYKNKKSPTLFMVLAAAGFQSFFQPCFRYFIFALFMAFLTRLSFENEKQYI